MVGQDILAGQFERIRYFRGYFSKTVYKDLLGIKSYIKSRIKEK